MDRVPSNRRLTRRPQSSSTSQDTSPSERRSTRSCLAAQARQAERVTIGPAGTDHVSNRKSTRRDSVTTLNVTDDELEWPEGRKTTPPRSRRRTRTIPDDEDDDIVTPKADLRADNVTRIHEPSPEARSPTAKASLVEPLPAEYSSGAEDQDARRRHRQPRSRPQFPYQIPENLQGVYQALGKDTWNEYLWLVERKEMGKLTEMSFARKSNRLFMTFDEATRERIDKLMTELVAPLVKDYMEHSL